MIPEERRDKILELVRKENVCSVKYLEKEFGVSRITIGRDLAILEENGQILKVHGGAKIVKQDLNAFETRFSIRYKQNYNKKLQIAKKALGFVKPQGSIFIDSSTTAYIFGLELFRHSVRDLSVVSNGPSLLQESIAYPDFKIISTGGELLRTSSMFAGEWVVDFIDKINLDCAFISAAGISENLMITTENRELSSILLKAIQKSSEVNLLMDSSKIFRKGMITVADLSGCTRIIVDDEITKEQRGILSGSGIEIV